MVRVPPTAKQIKRSVKLGKMKVVPCPVCYRPRDEGELCQSPGCISRRASRRVKGS